MYDVVADVEAYHKFVPWCTDSRVVYRRSGLALVELEVGFSFLVERYTSSVVLDRPRLVKVVYTDKVFVKREFKIEIFL